MRLVCRIMVNGVETMKVLTTVTGTEASFVKNKPGVGKPFLVFASLPGTVTAAELDDPLVPLVSSVTAENQAAIDAMLADPLKYQALLTFATPAA